MQAFSTVAKAIRILCIGFHSSRLTTVEDIKCWKWFSFSGHHVHVVLVGAWCWFWTTSWCLAVQGVLSCRHDPLGWREAGQGLRPFLSVNCVRTRFRKASLDHQRCSAAYRCPVFWGKLSSCYQSSCHRYRGGEATTGLDVYARQEVYSLQCVDAAGWTTEWTSDP